MTDEESKKRILARRARFVAAALASAGLGATGCGGEVAGPTACLDPIVDTGSSEAGDTNPTVCLSAPADTGARFDADVGGDSGADAGADADAAEDTATPTDAGPLPCLAPPLDGG